MIQILLQAALWEFLIFGLKQARASIFADSFFVLLFLSNYIPIFDLARYDFLFVSAPALQAVLYFTKIETWDEVKGIFLFHMLWLVIVSFIIVAYHKYFKAIWDVLNR